MSNIHKNFNSRTREGATKKQLGGRIGLLVSIHAPVWVRLYDVYIVIGLLEFQFTHPCGCDGKCPASSYYLFSFNSRTRVGATSKVAQPVVDENVSIHAPVWVRPWCRPHYSVFIGFQFTHPCGCDSSSCLSYSCLASRFNSRTRVGATTGKKRDELSRTVSIHAPVWVRLICR